MTEESTVAAPSRGFRGRAGATRDPRLPPGQYDTGTDWPVLSAEPTPRLDTATWTFTVEGLARTPTTWTWEQITALPTSSYTGDIHCVTKWSKLGTKWQGVTIDHLIEAAGLDEPPAPYLMAYCDGGYTTNLPVEDLIDGKGMVATHYDGEPLAPEHGGPARLLVPHLYFWKSAKWVRRLRFIEHDEPGFWESLGYHIYGDPWREQRYAGD